MHQPKPTAFQPAIYRCADCEIEHNGDVNSLPQGWDRVEDPYTGFVSVRCPDCLERVERDFIEACQWPRGSTTLSRADTVTATMGRAAAAYRGGLGR